MNVRQRSGRSTHPTNRGFTLIELMIAITLSLLVGGVVAAALITSLNVARATTDQVGDSADAGLISSFLLRDAQSAGSIDPATAVPDSTLGVSNIQSDTDGVACTSSPSVITVRFSWLDRSRSPQAKVVVTYSTSTDPVNSTKTQFIRRVCTDDATSGTRISTVDVLLGLPDEGRLTDRFGRVTWFRSAFVILTSITALAPARCNGPSNASLPRRWRDGRWPIPPPVT